MLGLLELPLDVHIEIASLLDGPDLRRLALTSKHFVAPVYDLLYRSVDLYLPRPEGGGVREIQVERYKQVRMLCFLRTMIERPDLAQKVRSIRLEIYGGKMYHHNNSFRRIMLGFDLDDVHKTVMKAWELMKPPLQNDKDLDLSTDASDDPPTCYNTREEADPEKFGRYVEEMLTRNMMDAYSYVLTNVLRNLCEFHLLGNIYHVRPCVDCPTMVGLPPTYPNIRSLSINYRNLSVLPPWSPHLQQLHLRCQGSSGVSYVWVDSHVAFPAPLLRSLTLGIPFFRGFVETLDRPLRLDEAISPECQTFRAWLIALAGQLQCANLRRLEIIPSSISQLPGGADFQGMTDVIMSTFPNIEEFALSPSYSLYCDRTFILPSRRIQRISNPMNLRHLTLTQLLLEDNRNANDPGHGRDVTRYRLVTYCRAPVGGFDLHTYDERNRSVFGKQDPNSIPYHYPILQILYLNLLSLDIWVHSANRSTLVFFQELHAARDNYPSLRNVTVCVPVADDIPYTTIKACLHPFVAIFRAVGILLDFSHRSLWPTEDDYRKDALAAEREDHEQAVRNAAVSPSSHLMPPLRVLRRYYWEPGWSPWGYHPDWNPNPDPLGEEAIEEVWTASRELMG